MSLSESLGVQETAEDLARLGQAAESLEDYVVRHDLGPLKGFPNTQQLADRHERNNDYLNYLMGHEAVQGGPGALLLKTAKRDDVLHGFQRGGEPDLAVAVAAFAIRSYVYAHTAMAHLADWGEPADAKALIAAADKLDEVVETSQARSPAS